MTYLSQFEPACRALETITRRLAETCEAVAEAARRSIPVTPAIQLPPSITLNPSMFDFGILERFSNSLSEEVSK